jgi:hypothetical protein
MALRAAKGRRRRPGLNGERRGLGEGTADTIDRPASARLSPAGYACTNDGAPISGQAVEPALAMIIDAAAMPRPYTRHRQDGRTATPRQITRCGCGNSLTG